MQDATIDHKDFCSNCETLSGFSIETRRQEVKIKGDVIQVEFTISKCNNCEDEVYRPETGNTDPFVEAHNEYRKRHGLLKPEEIKEWRKAYGLTQTDLATLLGLSVISISRYENGSLQNESHDKLIRLAMNPSNLFDLVSRTESSLDDVKKSEILRLLENSYGSRISS